VPIPEEHNARLSNLITSVRAAQSRVNARQTFGSVEELEEIGLLTMQMAALEELIALYCEILLVRPELGGFHPPKKSVLTKQLSDKLNLYRMLVVASGGLYVIGTELIEKNIAALKDLAEDRNAIIHGLLFTDENAQIVFRGRSGDVQATLGGLRNLAKRCHEATSELTSQFSAFYTELVGKKSTNASVEAAVQQILVNSLPLLHSSHKLRQSKLAARDAEAELPAALLKAEQSRKQFMAAKKTLRNAKDRLRRAKKRPHQRQTLNTVRKHQ
jgi:hypothetical protein